MEIEIEKDLGVRDNYRNEKKYREKILTVYHSVLFIIDTFNLFYFILFSSI